MGISILISKKSVITENDISHNGEDGIQLLLCSNSTIYRNYIVENAEGSSFKLRNNDLWGTLINLFTSILLSGVGDNVFDDSSNQWDNGSIGNYYGDFNCVDQDGDRICDSAYEIPGGSSVDRYPLAEMS